MICFLPAYGRRFLAYSSPLSRRCRRCIDRLRSRNSSPPRSAVDRRECDKAHSRDEIPATASNPISGQLNARRAKAICRGDESPDAERTQTPGEKDQEIHARGKPAIYSINQAPVSGAGRSASEPQAGKVIRFSFRAVYRWFGLPGGLSHREP